MIFYYRWSLSLAKYLLAVALYVGSITVYSQSRITSSIAAPSDDLEEVIATGAYDEGSSDLELVTEGAGIQIIGLRFQNIALPKGAQVVHAYLQFRADESNAEPTNLKIKIENSDNPTTFSPVDKISNRPTGDSILWNNVPAWLTGEQGPAQRSPDLKTLLQSIVNRAGWTKNNSMSFILTGNGKRVADAFDDSETMRKPAELIIEYYVPITVSKIIDFDTDDLEEIIVTGAFDEGSSDLEMVTESKGQQLIGLRFTNIGVPQNATITSAFIQFRADEANAEPTMLVIKSQAADNPGTFNSADKISSRILLQDSVVWANIPAWAVGERTATQKTPDLSRLVQLLVTRVGWAKGNAMAFVVSGTGKRVADAFDDTEALRTPAEFTITYLGEDNNVVSEKPKFIVGNFPITRGSIWKYNDGGTDLAAESWKARIYKKDSAWAFASAPLGYRQAAVKSNVKDTTTAGNALTTVYLRNTFIATEVLGYDSLVVYLLADDAASLYVNGVEVLRSNLPAGVINFSTTALTSLSNTNTYNRFVIDNTLLNNDTNSIAVELHQATENVRDAIFDLQVFGKLYKPAAMPFPIAAGSQWAAYDRGVALTSNWNQPGYNIDSWVYGNGPLGYGDPVNTVLSFGDDVNNKYPAIYFRKEFTITDPAKLSDSLILNIRRDDGAVVYINGVEVLRTNMPQGNIDFNTLSLTKTDGVTETQFITYKISKRNMVAGTNVIAVEVHQDGPTSSDLTFDLDLRSIPDAPLEASGCAGAGDLHIGCFTSVPPASKNQLLNIPAQTHSMQLIVQSGTPYTIGGGAIGTNNDFTGFVPDGMKSSVKGHLSINHETNVGAVSLLDIHYDEAGKVWVVDTSRAIDFTGLAGTQRNCSGAVTPWGTVITCEETRALGDVNGDGYQDHGWCIEIDPKTNKVAEYGTGKPQKLWALGRASHENVVVAQDSVTVYWGEDAGDGILYKFVAAQKMNLSAGTLYAMKLSSGLVANEPSATSGLWVVVPNATPSDRNATFTLAKNLGATTFNGIEDVEINPVNGMIYFTAKGNERTYRFKDSGSSVTAFETFVGGMSYQINTGTAIVTEPWGTGNDNLAFDDRGNLYVLQDGGQDHIWMVRPDHSQYNPKVEIFATTPAGSEPTGITFSPDYKFMFVSMQEPSATNTASITEASGKSIVFNKSTTLVIARKPFLGNIPTATLEVDGKPSFITIYPNPSEGLVSIQFFLKAAQMVKIEATDVAGKPVVQATESQFAAGNCHANLAFSRPGIYLVKVQSAEGMLTEKLIIK